MSTSYAAPTGPPPSTQNTTTSTSNNAVPNDDDPFDPPPAYTPSASASHPSQPGNNGGNTSEITLEAGPSSMDFSGPPPIPDRFLEQNITGVGVGFGRRPQHELSQNFTGSSSTLYPNQTGQSQIYNPPPLPPRNPSTSGGSPAPTGPPPSTGKDNFSPNSGFNYNDNAAGPSRPPPQNSTTDLSPTETPVPGRPLLWRGQLLVYPKGFWCHKCNNTGYKANDPSNPHETDWKKYGKPYNSALSTSYLHSTTPGSNASTESSSNFQRPLPSFPQQPQNSYGHLPPPPGAWGTYPGHNAHYAPRPPPPPPQHPMMGMPPPPGPMPGQQIFVQRGPGYVPPGALVVGPGDPRIGGRMCYKCGGSGRENDFLFGFDVGRCYTCQGLGRIF